MSDSCFTCGSTDLPRIKRQPFPKKRFCSTACRLTQPKAPLVTVTCAGCGITWELTQSRYRNAASRSDRLYHDQACYQKHKPRRPIVQPKAKA